MTAEDFDLDAAVYAFGLQFIRLKKWQIQDIPETKGFVLTPCMGRSLKVNRRPISDGMVGIETLMGNYSENFERSSKAVCRTAIDIILNECLTVMVSIVVPS